MMKELQIPNGAQAHFSPFILRHNFRAFAWGKRNGFLLSKLEGLIYPWTSGLIFSTPRIKLV